MNNITLEEIKTSILPILKQFQVKRAALFGSYVRGDNTESSDVDILVDLPRGNTILDLIKLEDNLKEKLQKKVDVVTYNGIHPLLKQHILQDQYHIL